MDTKFWLEQNFTLKKIPKWKCPTCNKENLVLDKDSFVYFKTGNYYKKETEREGNVYYGDVEYKFLGILKCVCKETVIFSGKGYIDYDFEQNYDGTYKGIYEDRFFPEYFNPPLNLFLTPKNCPKEIEEEIKKAFSLYWIDNASCANRIRTVLEIILNNRKIKKQTVNGKRKRVNISLHDRIEIFKDKEPEISEYLLALKWIGNDGSHVGNLKKENLMEAFELLEFALEKIYDDKSKRLEKLTKEINKRKGAYQK